MSERQQFLNAIYFAKSQALSLHSKITLCGSIDGLSCSGSWEKHLIVILRQKKLFQWDLQAQGVLHSRIFPVGKTELEFAANGWLNNENGTLWFCPLKLNNPDWAIVLNKAGRARVAMPNAQGEIKDDAGKTLIC